MKKQNEDVELIISYWKTNRYILKGCGWSYLSGLIMAPFFLPEYQGGYIFCYSCLAVTTLSCFFEYLKEDQTEFKFALDRSGVRITTKNKTKEFTWNQVKSISVRLVIISKNYWEPYIFVESTWSKEYGTGVAGLIHSKREFKHKVQEAIQRYAEGKCTFIWDCPSHWDLILHRWPKR